MHENHVVQGTSSYAMPKSYVTDDFNSPTAARAIPVLGSSDEHAFDMPRCRRRKLMPAGNIFSGVKVYFLIVFLNALFIAAKAVFGAYIINRFLSLDKYEITKANIATQSVFTSVAVADILSATGGIMALLYVIGKLVHKRRGAAIDDESARVVATGFSIAAFVGYLVTVGFAVKQHVIGKDGPNEETIYYLNVAAAASQFVTSLVSWVGVNPMVAGPCECSSDTKPFDRASAKDSVRVEIPACAAAYERAREGHK